MVIDLLVHEVAAKKEAFHRGQALSSLDGEDPTPLDAGERERVQEPIEVVEPVANSRHVAVAKQVVCAVDVESAAHALAQIAETIVAAQ